MLDILRSEFEAAVLRLAPEMEDGSNKLIWRANDNLFVSIADWRRSCTTGNGVGDASLHFKIAKTPRDAHNLEYVLIAFEKFRITDSRYVFLKDYIGARTVQDANWRRATDDEQSTAFIQLLAARADHA